MLRRAPFVRLGQVVGLRQVFPAWGEGLPELLGLLAGLVCVRRKHVHILKSEILKSEMKWHRLGIECTEQNKKKADAVRRVNLK